MAQKSQHIDENDKALPWVPEVFLTCGGNFRCWPKAETFRAGHYKDLTETGNRARKVSGTQGNKAYDPPLKR